MPPRLGDSCARFRDDPDHASICRLVRGDGERPMRQLAHTLWLTGSKR